MRTITQVSKIAGGSALSQVLMFLALPLILRVYSPSDWGLYATSLAIVPVATAVVTLQLQQALVLATTDAESSAIFSAGMITSMVGSMLLLVFALPAVLVLSQIDRVRSAVLATLTVLAILITAVDQMVQSLAVRQGRFGTIGCAAFWRAGVTILGQLALYPASMAAASLLLGYVLGVAASAAFTRLKIAGLNSSPLLHRFSHVDTIAVIRQHKAITGYGTSQEAVNSASQGVPVLLISAFFGQTSAGIYSAALRLVLAPSQLVANATRQVLSRSYAQARLDGGSLREHVERDTRLIAAPSVIGVVLLAPLLPSAIPLFLGPQWAQAGGIAQWLTLWAVMAMVNVPAVVALRTLLRHRETFVLHVVILLARVLCLVLCGNFIELASSIVIFSLVNVALNVALVWMGYHYTARTR